MLRTVAMFPLDVTMSPGKLPIKELRLAILMNFKVAGEGLEMVFFLASNR